MLRSSRKKRKKKSTSSRSEKAMAIISLLTMIINSGNRRLTAAKASMFSGVRYSRQLRSELSGPLEPVAPFLLKAPLTSPIASSMPLPIWSAAWSMKSSALDVPLFCSWMIWAPQFGQKRLPSGSFVPHFGQYMENPPLSVFMITGGAMKKW